MNILIAVTAHSSYNLVKGQIRFLTEQGNKVVFVSSYSKETKLKVESEGGSFFPIEMEREISPVKDFLALFRVVKLLRKLEPDVINTSTPKAGLLFTTASKILMKSKKIKVIFTLRGIRSDTLNGLKYKIVKLSEKICCTLADKVIVISPSLKEHAVNKNILKTSKGVVIGKGSSNGIDIKRFTKTGKSVEFAKNFRKENSLPKNAIVFGYVGRVVKDKGIKELYEAFYNMSKKIDNAYLMLVGAYNEADRIEIELLEEMRDNKKVILVEYTEDIEMMFSVMDVFILFSYREGFGNVSVEAAAMELPVIVSDIPGLRDTIENNTTGLLAVPKDSKDLENKMIFLYHNRELMRTYGINGRNRIENHFSNQTIWKGQLEVYKSLVN